MTGNDEDEEAKLCARCVGEPYLKGLIQRDGRPGHCSYCDTRGRSFPLSHVADLVETAFNNHYTRTATDADEDEDRAIRYGVSGPYMRKGSPTSEAIQMAARIEPEPADAITEILSDRHYDMDLAAMGEESDFDADAHYARLEVQDDGQIQEAWRNLERTLKSEARYFSRTAAATLAGVFDGVCDLKTKAGVSVVRLIGPGQALASLYRARALQSQDRLEEALTRPDIQVGPPTPPHARAGRMNARGVPVFYGATDWEIALAEVRPPVGSHVVVARFDLLRSLRLLDVAALEHVFVSGSVFDPALADQAQRVVFLQKLSRRIVAPVMPEAEDDDYLITQAMAEYLADQPELDLDGLYYPSVQRRVKGANVVLFHKASRIALLDLPPGTAINAFLHGGDEEDLEPPIWHVTEEVPSAEDEAAARKLAYSPWEGMGVEPWTEPDTDPRPKSLQVDLASVEVRYIQWARFKTAPIAVKRQRRVRHKPNNGAEKPF
jgi:hypothetical protein